MTIFLVEWPPYCLIKLVDWSESLFGNVSHNRVHNLALVVTLFASDYIFWGHSALGQIDIS